MTNNKMTVNKALDELLIIIYNIEADAIYETPDNHIEWSLSKSNKAVDAVNTLRELFGEVDYLDVNIE